MKYYKMFINWAASLRDKEKQSIDLMDNEHIIMQQLFNGQARKLKIHESMELFDKIESQFHSKVNDRYFDLHEIKDVTEKEIEMIEKYTNGKNRQKDI